MDQKGIYHDLERILMPGTPRGVVVDRRDLLGGRLVAMLNGLRMSRHLGVPFFMTWQRNPDAFHSYVPEPGELFSGVLANEFDPTSGSGSIISINDERLADCESIQSKMKTPESAECGIDDLYMSPKLTNMERSNFLLDRRFACYALSGSESFSDVKIALAREFQLMPKASPIQAAFNEIDLKIDRQRVAAVHLRRLHLFSDTYLPLSRFQSYCGTKTACAVVASLERDYDKVLVASDNPWVSEQVASAHLGLAELVSDIVPDLQLTDGQRAFVEMYILSKAEVIFAPVGAFGLSASLIGNSRFKNILSYAAEIGVRTDDYEDQTGSITFHKVRGKAAPAALLDLANAIVPPSRERMGQSGMFLRLAGALSDVGLHERARDIAVWSCALRATQHSSLHDFHDFLWFADRHCSYAGDVSSASRVRQIADLNTVLRTRFLAWGQPLDLTGRAREQGDRHIMDDLLELIELATSVYYSLNSVHLAHVETRVERAMTIATNYNLSVRVLRIWLAQVARNAGKFDREVYHLKISCLDDPHFVTGHLRLADALLREGMKQQAASSARAAARVEPEDAEVWFRLYDILYQSGNVVAAQKALSIALERDPANVNLQRASLEQRGSGSRR